MDNIKIENATDLNASLAEVLQKLQSGKISVDTAKAITLVADKINKNNVNQLDYKRVTKHGNTIAFFETQN